MVSAFTYNAIYHDRVIKNRIYWVFETFTRWYNIHLYEAHARMMKMIDRHE